MTTASPHLRLVLISAIVTASMPVGAQVVAFVQHTVEGDIDGVKMVRAVDLDDDGDLDILAAADGTDVVDPPPTSYPNDRVTWFENLLGDGSAWMEHNFSAEFAGASSVGAADIDGDGDLDPFATAAIDGQVRWWRSGGDAMFLFEEYVRDSVDGANWAEAGDIDGDGDLDLVGTALADRAVIWWENDGTPSTGLWPEYRLATTFDGAWSARPADLDHDGDLDILTSGVLENMIAWWENDGSPADGGWLPRIVTDTFSSAHGAYPADLDGDGDLDVVGVGLTSSTVAWWESDGSPANGGWTEHTVDTAFSLAFDAIVDDLDGDGDLDILGVAFSGNDVAWWENDGTPDDGGWVKHSLGFVVEGPQSIDAADIDGDGDLDLVGAANAGDDILWWENESIHRSQTYPMDLAQTIDGSFSGTVPGSIAIADVDRDGHPDVIAADPMGQDIVWWRNDGSPSSGGWVGHSVTGGGLVSPLAIVADDFDGDGDIDIASSSDVAPGNEWWENDGTPLDGGWVQHDVPYGSDFLRPGDMDGDGDPDLVSFDAGNGCDWYTNNIRTSGTWSAPLPWSTIQPLNCWVPPAIADIDDDGDLDVVGTSAFEWLTWWENNLPNQLDPWIRHIVYETTAVGVGVADIDSDGDVDVLALHSDAVSWYENDDTPIDGGWIERSVGSHPGAAGGTIEAADTDADGDLDILIAADNSDEVVVFRQGSSPIAGWIPLQIAATFGGASTALAHDIDHDGAPDIVGAAPTDGDLRWWHNGGGQFTLATTVLSPPHVENYESVGIFGLWMHHRGRSGDPNEELVTLELLFESQPGVALTGTQANALISNLLVYRDNGDYVLNVGIDPLVITVGTLVLDNGLQTVTFADGDLDVEVGRLTPKLFFVVVETTSDATLQSPNSLVVTHLTDPFVNAWISSAEDRDHDIPVTMEWAADVSTPIIPVVIGSIFADGFESGDTLQWSARMP